MIFFISTSLFIVGVIVFIWGLKSHKKEEEYYDKFYFIVSSHENLDDYLSLKNRIKDLFSLLMRKLSFYVENNLSHTEYHALINKAGYYSLQESTLFYIYISSIFLFSTLSLTLLACLGNLSFYVIPVFMIVYYIGSKIYLERKHKNEIKKFRINFVYFLDLCATCIKTGMTLTAALETVSPVLYRFSGLLGNSMQNFSRTLKYSDINIACEKLYEEVPLSEVKEFIATVRNSAQFGAGMQSGLQELSKEIRQFHFIETEEKIGSVNAKMGIPLILFIMFPVIVEIIAPGLLRAMGSLSLEMIS
ncbi:type II secretion system F family protein [Serratia marcescens]|uniref:type II secretion system F family protein n=1 Tax=Serratia TaxID=613 RepID=UPI0004E7575D|nr:MULTISPECIES: type II secretion system F family protein [Serratia]ASM33539.1 hypothetical protein BVG84_22095 [Serratia marcescens]EIV2915033.1 type II secretion system F family protein [Serratia marcescens]EMB2736498.1 type II secretion system F family protein [Serratia marcescens]KFF78346.1 hypothetical protein IY40_14640 [Serratia marcescens]MBE5257827.1 type II secretion system F family protein [Serratia marcescens]